MNNRSKAVQLECQQLFLRLYFRNRVEEHDAIVYSLRDNGFLAYVPAFEFKGPVYLQDRQGVVCLLPSLLGLQSQDGVEGLASGPSDTPINIDRTENYEAHRIKTFPGYSCNLLSNKLENSDEPQSSQLLVHPKEYQTDEQINSNSRHILRIMPMQRVRVAITAQSQSGAMTRLMELKLTLISSTDESDKSNNKKCDKKSRSDAQMIKAVMEEGGESRRDLTVNQHHNSRKANNTAVEVVNKKDRVISLYCTMKAVPYLSKKKRNKERLEKYCLQSHNTMRGGNRHEMSGAGPGRLAFGPEDNVRLIFRSRSNKSEIGKLDGIGTDNQRKGEEGSSNAINDKDKSKKNHHEDSETLVLSQLSSSKMAAIAKMKLYGEEWAEEEELPTSWEAGEGGGADTELGVKASSGGMGKEIALASSRLSKLKVAKKNSKYG